ncbi:ECF RNA polymerase sigma factor SigE [Frondihabitans sp. 762G35]|uniref:RNA polymerase sigma factor n=1 Tax=Frondihabitans sp. 762G35 TaxID=1446794 RepID=UPI000D225185|nr:sigma-70 family RNA polymerase sigma factor [Frondihabitans sp. 762G35]ARC56796.1 ECF RNA polymerase sigma factor SigE [Frondihabitans sp. 762G35]
MTPGSETDADLALRTAMGDHDALSTLFDRYVAVLTRYAWAIAARREDVEEIVQDTFVTLWSKAGTFELANESLLPWLLVVCRNHSLNSLRRVERSRSDELPDDLPARADDSAAKDQLRWVRDEIEALSPLDRRVSELCLLEGRSYAEAGEILGLSVGAVTQRVSRSRNRLKKAVTRDGQ